MNKIVVNLLTSEKTTLFLMRVEKNISSKLGAKVIKRSGILR
jgi:hypothetical protein